MCVPSVKNGMLICLYGEMRDALWPERGLSGSLAGSLAAMPSRRAGSCKERLGAATDDTPQTASPRASAAALRIAEMLVL